MPITIVGDYSQSIFEFQGATPDLFTNIDKFITTENITLKYNYRSVAQLVDLASQFRLIFKDSIPNVEEMIPFKEPSKGCLVIQEFDNSFQEYRFMAEEMQYLVREKGRKYSDIALISRINRNLTNMEAYCLKYRIPYKIKYDSQSILRKSPFKFIYSILSVAMNPLDVPSLLEIVSMFKGFGKVGVEQYGNAIAQHLAMNGTKPVYSIIENLNVAKDKKHTLFCNVCEYLVKPMTQLIQAKKSTPEQVFNAISSRLTKNFAFNDGSYIPDCKGYIDMGYEDFVNVMNILKNTVQSSEEDPLFKSKSCDQQVMDIYESLQLSRDSDDDKDRDAVVLSTIHSYKGLEAPIIFLSEVHTLMPLDLSVQEQRCLWYVAVTRAKEMLYITGSRRTPNYKNELKPTNNNPFLDYYIKGMSYIRAKYK